MSNANNSRKPMGAAGSRVAAVMAEMIAKYGEAEAAAMLARVRSGEADASFAKFTTPAPRWIVPFTSDDECARVMKLTA